MQFPLVLFVLLLPFWVHVVLAFNPFEDATKMDYMSSAYAVRTLSQVEQKVLNVIIQYKKSLEKKLEILNKYMNPIINEMENSKTSFRKIRNISIFDLETFAIESSAHLFKSLHVIQRFANEFPILETSGFGDEPEKLFQSSIEELKQHLYFPDYNDAIQSMLSVLRLKQTYNLSVSELFEGNLLGLPTNSGLRADDLLQFGILAMRTQMFTHSLEFLEASLRLENQKPVKDSSLIARVKSLLRRTITSHDKGLLSGKFVEEQNVFHFEEPLQSLENDSYRLKVQVHIKPDFSNLSNTVGVHKSFDRLCSGDQLRKPSVTKHYKCTLLGVNTTDIAKIPFYFILQPLKIEYLNEDPPIALIHEVLSNNEIDKILKDAGPNLKRSLVASPDKLKTNFGRTSSNTWIPDYDPGNPFQFISKRVEAITGLRVNYYKAVEHLQVANYGPGGLYAPHYDVARSPEELNDDLMEIMEERGDRIATFMFYLSEVERGGGTAFPALGIAVQPIKGSAVFWYNLKNDGTAHLRTLHGGCPVLHGSKWIANKWIRYKEQMLTKKCLPENR